MSTPNPQRGPLHLPFIILAILVAVGFAIDGTLLVLAPEQSQEFVTFFLASMSVVTSFAALVYQLGKNQQVMEEIRTNTNGNLSAEREARVRAEAKLAQAGIPLD